mmetsp:Transcript_24524/g.56960  ORF Transcript_24524/g.56960 Transcript_24524/m.56960 type:complete len:472 (+) Transcript_24524:68-1483(+)
MKLMQVSLLLTAALLSNAAKFKTSQNQTNEDGCTAVQTELTKALITSYCKTDTPNEAEKGPDAKACFSSDTPAVRKSLANHMFNHCGARYIYDFDKPMELCYEWFVSGSCWKRGTACKSHVEKDLVIEKRHSKLCKAACIASQPTLTEKVAKSYCTELVVNEANYGPTAVACNAKATPDVRLALANKMFHHCGAHYLYDFDNPAGLCYSWSGDCWKEDTKCLDHADGRRAVARKSMLCEVKKVVVEGKRCKGVSPYTFDKSKTCDGWSKLTASQCTEKCDTSAVATNCPQKTCRAAAFYPSTGWCHLYDSCPELEDSSSASAIVTKVPMKTSEGKRCKSKPFTFDKSEKCDGWGGLTLEQCAQKCTGNEQAASCPQKTCVAATFYESTGWCHLYDTCPELEVSEEATAIIPEASRWCSGKSTEKVWSCDEIKDAKACTDSFTRSLDGHYFVQCAVTTNGQCLASGGLCKPK